MSDVDLATARTRVQDAHGRIDAAIAQLTYLGSPADLAMARGFDRRRAVTGADPLTSLETVAADASRWLRTVAA